MISTQEKHSLLRSAKSAYDRSYSPYSKEPCGASILTERGIIDGCRIDNICFVLSLCAAKAAIMNGVSKGCVKDIGGIKCLALYGLRGENGTCSLPCGGCRQVMIEFGDFPVVLACGKNFMAASECCGDEFYCTTSSLKLLPFSTLPQSVPHDRITSGTLKSLTLSTETFSTDPMYQPPIIDGTALRNLAAASINVCDNAFIPYANIPVGASVLTHSGEIFAGCNMMNRSFSHGNCAETAAISLAVMYGSIKPRGYPNGIAAVAVICLCSKTFTRCCGACRQVLKEFGNFPVICLKPETNGIYSYQPCWLQDLLPHSFTLER